MGGGGGGGGSSPQPLLSGWCRGVTGPAIADKLSDHVRSRAEFLPDANPWAQARAAARVPPRGRPATPFTHGAHAAGGGPDAESRSFTTLKRPLASSDAQKCSGKGSGKAFSFPLSADTTGNAQVRRRRAGDGTGDGEGLTVAHGVSRTGAAAANNREGVGSGCAGWVCAGRCATGGRARDTQRTHGKRQTIWWSLG